MFRRFRYLHACLVVLIIIFSVAPVFGCKSKERIAANITVGIGTWAGFAVGIVGMEKGFFDNLKVETKILDDNAARHAAFQSGALDIMNSSIDVFAQEAAQGVPGKAFLITDESAGGDGIVAKADIKTAQDLRGKKVAYARGTPSHYLLYKILQSNGMSISDVQHVEIDDPTKTGDVFLSGGADAAVTWEPFLSQIADSGKGHILATTKDYPEIIVDLLVASDKLSADADTLHRFMDGWLKTVDYIKANPDEAAKIMAKGLNLKVEDVQGMMMGLKFADRERNKQIFSSPEPKDARLAKLLDEAGAYCKSVDIVKEPVGGASRVLSTSCKYFNNQ